MTEFFLSGPRGDNPLGFLTALGSIRVMSLKGHETALHWDRDFCPTLTLMGEEWLENKEADRQHLVDLLYLALKRSPPSEAVQSATDLARKTWEKNKKAAKNKANEIRSRHLKGMERQSIIDAELTPIKIQAEQKRLAFISCLQRSACDPALTLGTNLTASCQEFDESCRNSLLTARVENRRWPDLNAAFGFPIPIGQDGRMSSTPFALISGSRHQHFLSSVEALMINIRPDHIAQALFGPWEATDEKHSLRLDPLDDRRYALMDCNPSDDNPLTLWGANLLAFEALAFFPCMPLSKTMAVSGWRQIDGSSVWRWPLWEGRLRIGAIKSLLAHPDCWRNDVDARRRLRAIGCLTVIESKRIDVGTGQNKKHNLTPGIPLW